MKPALKRSLLTAPLLLLVIAGGAAWALREGILQHMVRPWLESLAGSALNAEVRIGGLAPAQEGVWFTNVSMRREDGSLLLVIPEAGISFTLPGLLQRRLERVEILRPDLFLAPGGDGEPTSFPRQPPLEIGAVKIRGGGVRVRTPEGPILLHGVEAGTRGVEPIAFRVSAYLGEGTERPLFVAGELLWSEGLSLTLETFQWQEIPLLDSPLTIRLPAEGERAAAGGLRLERLESAQLEALFAALQKEFPLPPELRFTLFSPRLDFGWEAGRFRLQGSFERGTLQVEGRSIAMEKTAWSLRSRERGWGFESRFALAAGSSGQIDGTFSDGAVKGDLQLEIPHAADFLMEVVGERLFPTAGGLVIEGDFHASESGFRLDGSFGGLQGEKHPDDLLDLSPLSGRLSLARDGEPWSGRATVSLDGKEIAVARARDKEIAITISAVSGRVLRSMLGPGSRQAIPDGMENVRAKLRLLPEENWSGTARITAGRIPLGEGMLEDVRLSGRFHAAEGSLRSPRFAFSCRMAGEGLPTGKVAASGSGAWQGEKWSLHFDRLEAEEMDYISPAGDSGFAGARLGSAGTVSGAVGGDSIALDLTGTLSLRELLYGTFYAELSGLPGTWSLRGTLVPDEALLRPGELSFAVEKVGNLTLEGRISPATIRIRVKVSLERLEDTFSERLLPALRERFEGGKGLRVSGGVAADFTLDSDPGGWHARGALLPGGLDIGREFLEARGLEGSLPFDIHSGDPPAGLSAEERSGRLSFDALSLGPARFEGDALEVLSSPNRFHIPGTASFRLGNGQLLAEETSFGLGSTGPEFSARIDVREIDLEVLTGELGWMEMTGGLDADLGRIEYAGDTLASEGNMVAEVFGGTVLVSGIRMEAPFSDYPLLFGDIDFSGIDLHQLTRTFSFGAINGVADGFIHDLRLLDFTPSRFEAVLETREEGSRSISVKALENLTVISQGGLSGALSRGFFRFIDFYRYRRIGIWCLLRRDVFILRGTAKDDSERHLVYGGLLPPKIDILAPEHAISFKEMLNRLQRIERTDEPEEGAN